MELAPLRLRDACAPAPPHKERTMQSAYPDHIVDRIERRWQRWLRNSGKSLDIGNPEVRVPGNSAHRGLISVPHISESHEMEMLLPTCGDLCVTQAPRRE